MIEHEASRTLVKSRPELWAECSEATSLARHIGEFGEIRITRLEPETAVAWEGDVVRGTVRLEPSGWGTRVILTAAVEAAEPELAELEPEPEAEAELAELEPEAVNEEIPESAVSEGLFARLARRLRRWRAVEVTIESEASTESAPEVAASAEPRQLSAAAYGSARPEPELHAARPEPELYAPEPEPAPGEPESESPSSGPGPPAVASVLDSALDSLGSAHHRPFSRA
jgi:hypothetical protein